MTTTYTVYVNYDGGIDPEKDALIKAAVGSDYCDSGCFMGGGRDMQFYGLTRQQAGDAAKRVRRIAGVEACFDKEDDE